MEPLRFNLRGMQTVLERHWLTKKDASVYFSRITSNGRIIRDASRLHKAVNEGKIHTKVLPAGRTVYNAWDCLCECNIF